MRSAIANESRGELKLLHSISSIFLLPQYHQLVSHAPQNQQYPQNVTHATHHQEYAQNENTSQTRFDDAPWIVYGIAERTRENFDCNEPGQDCEDLEYKGKVVDCEIPRFG